MTHAEEVAALVAKALTIRCRFCGRGHWSGKVVCYQADSADREWPHQVRLDDARRLIEWEKTVSK